MPNARIIIVDDSVIVRQVLRNELERHAGIEVVATAADPLVAREKILELHPDCVILDLEMPKMDGLTFLRKLMKFHPVPVIVCSGLTPKGCALAVECLEAGAFEVVSKPGGNFSVGEVAARLAELVHAAATSRPRPSPCGSASIAAPNLASTRLLAHATGTTQGSTPTRMVDTRNGNNRLIAIGTSTGGTEALRVVLSALPLDTPGIVMVQHMPEGFTKAFADRLNTLCALEVREAQDGDVIRPGRALLARGNRHMRVVREGSQWVVRVFDGPRVMRHKPSVEVLFESAAQVAGARALGVIMTGMGGDGATGLLAMRKAGAVTIAQDEQSCVVFGMPREAIRCGGAQIVAPLDRIAKLIGDFTAQRLAAEPLIGAPAA